MTLHVSTTNLGDGAVEIGIRDGVDLVAVLTRPVRRGKWFLRRASQPWHRPEVFKTRKAALAAAGVTQQT